VVKQSNLLSFIESAREWCESRETT